MSAGLANVHVLLHPVFVYHNPTLITISCEKCNPTSSTPSTRCSGCPLSFASASIPYELSTAVLSAPSLVSLPFSPSPFLVVLPTCGPDLSYGLLLNILDLGPETVRSMPTISASICFSVSRRREAHSCGHMYHIHILPMWKPRQRTRYGLWISPYTMVVREYTYAKPRQSAAYGSRERDDDTRHVAEFPGKAAAH